MSSEVSDSPVSINRLDSTHLSSAPPVLTNWLDITDVSSETPDSSSVYSLAGYYRGEQLNSRLLQCPLTGWTDIRDVSSDLQTPLVSTHWLDITDVSNEPPDSSSVYSLAEMSLQM